MASRSPLALVAAALLGALAGGLAGAWVAGARAEPAAPTEARPASPGEPRSGADSMSTEGIELLLTTLVDEVRALRLAQSGQRTAAPIEEGVGTPLSEGDRTAELLEAIRALTRAVQSGGGSAFGIGGRGLPVVDLPPRAGRFDLLSERLAIEDEHERVRPFLLWNYQQVLDHFGSPTAVHQSGHWMYRDPDGSREITLTFAEGLLTGIW